MSHLSLKNHMADNMIVYRELMVGLLHASFTEQIIRLPLERLKVKG